ncbi:phosphopantetheine-binding protein [bacterium]|nr:phosphopantetheine-binding protein [bacterium]
MNEIEVKVLTVLAETINVSRDKVDLDARMNVTEGWDSLATVRFIVALEYAFDEDISLDAAEKMISAQFAVDYFTKVLEA